MAPFPRLAIPALMCAALPAMAASAVSDRYPDHAFGATPRINQQDPAYQNSVEHLSRARHLLAQAQREASASFHADPLPGFRYDLLKNDIKYIRAQLAPVLFPERRRLRYQQLVPDASYLTPRASAVIAHPARRSTRKGR